MLTDAQRRAFAEELFAAELEHRQIAPFTETHPEADMRDAYAVAQYVTAAKVASGLEVRGHKIGLTSQVMRELSGATEPDYGTLFSNQFLPEGDEISAGRFNSTAIEIELAFVLGEQLRGPDVTIVDVIRATDFVLPAIEIVDMHYHRLGPGAIVVDSVSDGAWCGGIVLGGTPRRLDQFDVRAIEGVVYLDGAERTRGSSAAVMGSPLNAVAWLANKLSEFDTALEPGHVVMSGSFVKIFRIKPGSEIRATFDVFGDVSFALTE